MDGLTAQEAQDSVGAVLQDAERVGVMESSDLIGEFCSKSGQCSAGEDLEQVLRVCRMTVRVIGDSVPVRMPSGCDPGSDCQVESESPAPLNGRRP